MSRPCHRGHRRARPAAARPSEPDLVLVAAESLGLGQSLCPGNALLYVTVFIFGCAGSSLLHALLSTCGERGLSFAAARGLLIAVASLVAEHGL